MARKLTSGYGIGICGVCGDGLLGKLKPEIAKLDSKEMRKHNMEKHDAIIADPKNYALFYCRKCDRLSDNFDEITKLTPQLEFNQKTQRLNYLRREISTLEQELERNKTELLALEKWMDKEQE